uniref:ATP synthase F0 subunit 8 n=1 Tax=Homaemus proteus TaxID=2080374 RepID=A0A2P1CLS1_9HEMI|nr:ATP synthase F0 subunit 8 [Homaemus proteus]
MPQMAPLYWEALFFMFIVSLMMVSIIIYHLPKITSNLTMSAPHNYPQANWKW